jgi:ABC-type glycerol-3-phosphate transport system substrate-binding protein
MPIMPRSKFGVRSQFNLVAVIIFGLAAVTAWIGAPSVACSEEAAANDTATVSESNPIVVWVDATRKPGIEAFIKANPDVPVKLVLYGKQYGSPQLQEKFSLWNRTGSGWPDMIFFGDVQDMAWAASPAMHYAATLNTLVPPAVQSGFSESAAAPCTDAGRLVCLRNDIAPDVLWYNVDRMHQWGYAVPKTWPEFERLGLQVAKEHPGWFIGAVGDSRAIDRYFWASGCPLNDLVAPNTVHIDINDPKCTRVVKMLDTLIKANALSTGNWQAADFVDIGQHLLVTPGPTWYGVGLFKNTCHVPAGQMSAAPPLGWPDEAKNWTGSEGGGMYVASSHITGARLGAVLKVALFMSTDLAWQTSTVTMPAYGPSQRPWLEAVDKTGYFAEFPALTEAFVSAGLLIRPGFVQLTYSTEGVWQSFVVPAIVSGQTIESVWQAFGIRLQQYAQAAGYKVQH